ncbi:helix-turn-helix transcriptional regulator [Amycolatopsis magusensis]|uniref:helix-turn-helix transcriptional regulator n=1 Tax=Amycolatopsis magusensis TaxID=882444 RepID=UPI0024A96A28|nr:LuxR family transcriptional regulator [Amycolatopsis magusensis]MDI5982526.1 AAA family ATPase [Amycolatopsis magusensis]
MQIARDEQLAALKARLADAESGTGTVTVLSGGVACGKTTLLSRFAGLAEDAGARVLRAGCARAEQGLPFGALAQLLPAAALADEQILKALDHDPDSVVAENDLLRVSRAVGSALFALAAGQPLVLLLDDAQYCDAPSMACLLYLVRRLGGRRVALVLTEGAGPLSLGPAVRAELSRQPHFQALSVDPLTTGNDLTLTGGNPQLVRGLAEGRFGEALLGCLHRAAPSTVEVLSGIAVLGSAADVAELLGREVDADLLALRASGLLDATDHAHPDVAAAALGTLSPAAAADLHERAAVLTHTAGAAPEEVAGHLLRAPHLRPDWAAAVLTDAADAALRDQRPADAVRYLELARDTTTDPAHRLDLASLLARVTWRLDPGQSTRHLEPLVSAARDGRLTGRDSTDLVGYLLWQGKHEEALATIRGLAGDAQQLAQAELWLSTTYPGLKRRIRFDQLLPGGQPAGTSPRPTVLGAEHLLQRSQFGERDQIAPQEEFGALLTLVYAGRLDAAAHWGRLHHLRLRTTSRTGQALLAAVRAEIAMRQGELTVAHREASEALRVLSERGWGVGIGFPLANLLLALIGMGRMDEAAEIAERPVPQAMFDTRFGLHYVHARGHYSLAIGRHQAALADFLFCGELMHQWGLDQPSVVPWRSSAAQAWLELGNRGQARKLLDAQLALAGQDQPRVRGISLRVLAAASDPGQRPQLVAEAVKLLESCGDRLERTKALQLLTGDRRQPAPRTPRPKPARPASEVARGLDKLSESESRVAALAVCGCSNREIAGKLYITVSTVEQHLTRTYRKLGIKRRCDLPIELQTLAIPSSQGVQSA